MAIKAGNYAKVAAAYAGIGESTFYAWMDKGRAATRGKYKEFQEAVELAEAEAQVVAVSIIRKALPDDPRLALQYLERRYPNVWGKRVKEHTHDVKVDLASLSDDELLDIIQGGGSS